jgi:hypothetical protein
MSRNTSRIDVSRSSESINRILAGRSLLQNDDNLNAEIGKTRCFYNQNEDQFIILPGSIIVPALPVHHAMDNREPPAGYEDMIENLATALLSLCPGLIAGTTWYFDPNSIHTPTFYRKVRVKDADYLYLLLIDLTCRPLEFTITETGTNNRTHAFTTNRLYFECDWFPLESSGENEFNIAQSIPFTWKGEAGQGYMVHGLWMDADINKFFSKLVLPEGKRSYPYYPLTCKQHCVSMNALGQRSPELLHSIRQYIEPELDDILDDLHSTPFSEQMPLFEKLKKKMPAELGERWRSLSVSVALNEREHKEYTVEF